MSISNKALWFVESHLREELSLDSIAEVLQISPFHLTRAFGATTGHSLAAYVRGRRLTEAAKLLASGAPDIFSVALEFGYGSHEAFTRAFRQQFGQTPEQLRSLATLQNLNTLEPLIMKHDLSTPMEAPRLVDGQALLLFGLKQHHQGSSNAGIPAQWGKFVPYLGSIQGQTSPFSYGVVYNHGEAGEFDYLCAVEVSRIPSAPAEFSELTLAPQRYAVFEHRDHISSIGKSWNRVWNEGLPASGCTVVDAPFFERYGPEFDGRTGLGGLELWIPIQA